MKKMKFLGAALGLIIMASCNSAGDKSAGAYNGNYNVMGTDYAGKVTVTKVSDTKVNMNLVCYSPAVSDQADGVSIITNGNDISFSYSNTSTVDWDMQSITGTLSGNNITLNGVVYIGGGNQTGVFTGTK